MSIQVPTWRIDGMTFPGKHEVDAQGREWTILRDGETGWQGSPGLRNERTNRPLSHGTFRGAGFREARILTLKGRVWCPDEDSREDTELELAALCSDPGRLYEYRRTTARHDMVVSVELDDEVMVTNPSGTLMLEYSFQFAAPDPRKHSFSWQEPISTVPVSGVDGVDWAVEVDWAAGMDFGFHAEPSISKVANYGTAPAYPLFRIKGPLPGFSIRHVESGRVIDYGSTVAAGEVIYINCDSFAQRGVVGHACESSTRGNVRSLLSRLNDFPVVQPKTVATFQLQSTGSATAELMTQLRSASW